MTLTRLLTHDGTPTADDYVHFLNSPGGTPADRRCTLGELFGAPFAITSMGASLAGTFDPLGSAAAAQVAAEAYADAVAQGLSIKLSARVATTAALPANTYAAGVLTATGNGALTVDGVAVAAGNRVLVKNEVAGLKNGLYTVTNPGSGGAPYVLTRTTDMDAAAEIPGAFVFVEEGTTNTASGWVVASAGPFTVGTTAITWTQFSGAGTYTAGTALTLTGSQFSVSDPELLAIAGLTSAVDTFPYFTGSGTASLATVTSTARSLLDDVSTTAMQTTLGLLVDTNIPGLDTGGAVLNNRLPPERRFSKHNRTITGYLANSGNAQATEFIITDSMGHTGASAPETTSWLARYEAEMSRAYNRAARTVGFVPTDLWTVLAGTEMSWDSVPAAQHTTRGPSLSNKQINAAQSATITRNGTGVTIFYTAQRTGGAVLNVTINGSSVGTIDTRDGTIAVGVDFDSGRIAFFATPSGTGFGPMTVVVAHSGTGTTGEIEGAYFHNNNADVAGQRGLWVIRGGKSGLTLANVIDATTPGILQVIANRLPQAVTIMLGCNDAQAFGLGATLADAQTVAARLATLITDINALYPSTLPSIRYIFQWKWNVPATCPTNWLTDWRSTLRQQCITSGALFVDMHDTIGPTATTGITNSADGLHPNDLGHGAIGQLMADITAKASNTRVNYLDLNLPSSTPQQIGNALGVIQLKSGAGAGWYLMRDTGAATASGAQLGAVGFGGAQDAFGTLSLSAAIRSDAEELFTATHAGAGLRFMTTATGGGTITDKGGFTAAGQLFIGATNASALFTVSQAGVVNLVQAKFAGATSGTITVIATAIASGTLTLPAATDTLMGRNTVDTLTNKSLDPGVNTSTGHLGLLGSSQTVSVAPDFVFSSGTPVYTLDFVSAACVQIIAWAPTFAFKQSPASAVSNRAIQLFGTMKNDAAAATNLAAGATTATTRWFSDEMVFSADSQNIFVGGIVAFAARGQFTRSGGGTITDGTYTAFSAAPLVSAGATVSTVTCFSVAAQTVAGTITTLNGLKVNAPTISGTVTNFLGVDIAQIGGTTPIGWRNASNTVATPTVKTITAITDTIPTNATTVELNNTSGASKTLTSTPTIADGQDGQILVIFNGSAQNVVLNDQGTTAGSNLRLGANRTLGTRDSIMLMYSSTVGDWIELAFSNVL